MFVPLIHHTELFWSTKFAFATVKYVDDVLAENVGVFGVMSVVRLLVFAIVGAVAPK